jgi:hemerythrin-like domain-containing protein
MKSCALFQIRLDFILISGDTVCNINLEKALFEHIERRKKDKLAIKTMITKKGKPNYFTHQVNIHMQKTEENEKMKNDKIINYLCYFYFSLLVVLIIYDLIINVYIYTFIYYSYLTRFGQDEL